MVGLNIKKIALIFFFILSSITVFSQDKCDPNYILEVKTDSCDYVEMSLERFAYYFKAEKNLKEIQNILPELKSNVDSTSKLNSKIDNSFKNEIDTLKNQRKVLETGMKECTKLSVDLESKNISLLNSNKKLTSQRNKLAIGGTASVILLIIIIML